MRGRVVIGYGDRECRNGVRLMRKRRSDLAEMVARSGKDPANLGKAALVAVILGKQIETGEVADERE